MAKRSLVTLAKEGIAGTVASSGVAILTYLASKFTNMEKYFQGNLMHNLEKYFQGNSNIVPIIRDFGIPATVGLVSFYFVKDMLETYDQNLLERQLIKDQKKMQKLQEEKNYFDVYMQKKQKDLQELQEEVQGLETVKD